jgi:hypothetical protein
LGRVELLRLLGATRDRGGELGFFLRLVTAEFHFDRRTFSATAHSVFTFQLELLLELQDISALFNRKKRNIFSASRHEKAGALGWGPAFLP